MERSAHLLKKPDDADRFAALSARVELAFNRRFYDPKNGYYDNRTQASCVLPLAFGLVPGELAPGVFAHLVHKITVESNTHLATATIYLPAHDLGSITENGTEAAKTAGVASAEMRADRAVLHIGSGSYHFVSRP